jgi:hypothetical protein
MMKLVNVAAALMAAGVLAAGARAQGAVGGAQATKIFITTKDPKDTAFVARRRVIDSLLRKQENVPIGSTEFAAIDSALVAVFREMQQPLGTAELHIVASPRSAFGASPMDVAPKGTLGFTAAGLNRPWYTPRGLFVQYFEYPTIVTIEGNSPASRAGVRVGDSLIAYNGLDVRAQAINITALLTPGRDVSVRLRREGDVRDVTVPVEKAPERLMVERRIDAVREMEMVTAEYQRQQGDNKRMIEENTVVARAAVAAGPTRPQGGAGALAPTLVPGRRVEYSAAPASTGVLGAAMVSVDPGMANSLKGMDGKQGVYVTFVPQGSIAERAANLRSGDVILRVESYDIENVNQLRVRLQAAEQSGNEKIKLTVMRAGKSQELTYVPPR